MKMIYIKIGYVSKFVSFVDFQNRFFNILLITGTYRLANLNHLWDM